MLTNTEILNAINSGKIKISPFEMKQLNPNSYNLRLGTDLAFYKPERVLDPKELNAPDYQVMITEPGFVLEPGILYLASTLEYTETDEYIPCISGRSSIARLGIEIHRTAGFGDIGFKGTWTLEITVVNPVRVYPGMEICQIYYEKPDGFVDPAKLYNGKYSGQRATQISLMYKDFEK